MSIIKVAGTMATLLALAGGTAGSARAISVDVVERHAARVDGRVAGLEKVAARYATWRSCVQRIPVSEYGDPSALGDGYAYDERDGTGVGPRSALGPAPAARADYAFLAFDRRAACGTRPTRPGGTAESARAARRGFAPPSLGQRVSALEAHVAALERRRERVARAADRFDVWESCVSQLPVTGFGDADGAFGFLAGGGSAGRSVRYRSAIAIDRTDWDDPDYRILAFRRGDRPGHDCDNDTGEASD